MTSAPLAPFALWRAAPQLPALAILDAALMTAGEVLLAHYPTLDKSDAVFDTNRAPPDHCLVPILLAHLDELHYLLGRYQVAVQDAHAAADDDIPF
jgi:hypothetical protein